MLVKPSLVLIAVAGIAAAMFFVGPRATVARPAENFRLHSTRGTLVSLDEFRGKIVVLDFFASWCGPSQRALPDLERIHDQYRDQPVVLLGVNVHEKTDPVDYLNSKQIPFPVLLHGEKVAEAYGVSSIPAVLVISPDGQIVYRGLGWNSQKYEKLCSVIDAQITQLR